MGFGWLFIGYFAATLMTMNPIGFLIRPVGYALMLFALHKLKDYHRDFWYSLYGSVAMLVLSLVLAVNGLLSLLSTNVVQILGYVEMLGAFIFHAALLFAIRSIAKETEAEKISFAAARNFVFFVVYNLLYAIAFLPFAFAEEYAKLMSVPVILLYFACLLLNLILIFSCYAKICDVSDVDMTPKPSRFAFVNRMREESEARRNQRAAMYAERQKEKKVRREQKRK